MNYRLGLDIGITSVGWAVLEHDNEENPFRIEALGVRIFDEAENPKDGSALALPRRQARSARRRLRRHRHRLERIKHLFNIRGLVSQDDLYRIYQGSQQLTDIYELRKSGLDLRLNNEEWARVLVHIAQRRGFKSNRKKEAKNSDAGRLLTAVKENKSIMDTNNYRTIGEMFFLNEKFVAHKRNKADDYSHTIGREQVLDEIRLLFSSQRQHGNPYADEDFEAKYTEIVGGQRLFDEGPGQPSPYAGNQIEKMVGRCRFERDEPRAAKACYSFERFNLLQKINSIRIGEPGQVSRPLSSEERQKLVQVVFEKTDLKYSDIRKTLQIPNELRFNMLNYGHQDMDEVEEKSKFNYLKAWHEIRKAVDKVKKGRIKEFTVNQLDTIGTTLTLFSNEDTILAKLTEAGLSAFECEELYVLSFRGHGHLSLKAIAKITPYLEQGYVYSEATTMAGYDFRAHDNTELDKYLPAQGPELEDISNRVVRRAVSQTIKVINAVIRQYDRPQLICIELSREMAKDFQERKKIEKQIKENTDRNDAVKLRIQEYGHKNPSGHDIVKMKLWQEQDGRCAYSGASIPIAQLFEKGIADVDHIIPYSVSFNDSYANKVLALSSENRQKGNLLPLQYLQNDPEKLNKFMVWANNVRHYRKRQNLLKQTITEEDINRWKERPLNDTKYISIFMLNYIRDNLQFAPAEYIHKRKVIAVNGNITSYLRKRWGLNKDRAAGDLHHAMDAAVVACTTEGMIRQITHFSQYHEVRYSKGQFTDYETGEVIPNVGNRISSGLVLPWPMFKLELESRLSEDPTAKIRAYQLNDYPETEDIQPVFVSRMPKRKNTGAAHKETIRSARMVESGYTVSKVDIKSLKLNSAGEIEGYYNPQDDRKLYEALKQKLEQYDGNGNKAFAEPFYKPAAPGKTPAQVKKVKIIQKSTLNVQVNQGAADNGDMLRIDIFKKQDGYYLVPIYVADTIKKELPNKAVVAHKPYEEWPEMDDKDFLFSLYRNDPIRFVHKTEVNVTYWNGSRQKMKEAWVYYTGSDISTGAISVQSHDKSFRVGSLGIKTLISLEKWSVDVLGQRTRVKKEKRQYYPGQTKRGD